MGDTDFDGFVGMNDFINWRNDFDAGGGGVSAVPEPASGLMAFFGLFVVSMLRRRRAR